MAWLSALLKSLPFANSAMLLWGLAAAVPILIHLLSKRRYRETTWAAMQFLLEAVRKNTRRIRIEQLILLLIRVAILLLLAVALADPILSLFPALGTALGSRARTHFVLVLDGSYSMDYRSSDKSRFDMARQLAAQLVEDSRQGDGFTLVLMADPPHAVIAEPAFDPKDVLEELEGLRVQHTGANLAMTLAEVEGVLQRARQQRSRLTDCKVCFFTDLGRTTWEEVTTEDCRVRVGRLAEFGSLLLFDVGQADDANLAVTELAVRESLVTAGREATVEAAVRHFGTQKAGAVRLQLLVDGQQTHTQSLDVPAGGRVAVAVAQRLETPGEHFLEARLSEDGLPLDNRRWLSVPVREAIRVLCVQGQEGAARHVALALEPAPSERPRVRPEIRFESVLLEADLNQYDAVFLCNVARFSREEAAVLNAYVRQGGGLVVTLGDQVQADSYNAQLGGEAAGGARVLPARLERLAPDAQYAFNPLDYRHPLVAPFARHERSGLLTTPVWRYFRLAPYDKTAAKVALAFQNGDPALVEEPLGRGRCILLATAASPDSVDRTATPPTPWTAIAAWPSFPPLIQEMLALAVRSQGAGRNVLVGEPLEGRPAAAAADAALSITTPDGGSERVPIQRQGPRGQWTFGGTAASGLYAAQYAPPRNEKHWYAVNVNPRESNLERWDGDQLPSQFTPSVAAVDTPAPLPATRSAQSFRWFLGTLLALLLTETFLAWYFGSAAA